MKTYKLEDVAKIVALLKEGKVGVMPTDTVYGLVCSAHDEAAVAKLYALKHRHAKPGTVIAYSQEQLTKLGLKKAYLKADKQFWPNAISVVVPCGKVLEYLHQGVGSLAVRLPKPVNLRQLLAVSGPLLTTSANRPGEETAHTIQEAIELFGAKVDFYVDGGRLVGHKPSTIIRIVDDAIEIVRLGAVQLDEAGRVIPEE